jgi:UDP-N-acetylglucosamine acyltransferase
MIHPTAIISTHATLDPSVEVGPYSIIGDGVTIGRGTRIGPHVVIEGPLTMGENCTVFQFCSLGAVPQDLKYHGESSTVIIGNNNIFRECVTINRGTEGGGMRTVLGDNNMIMAYSHIAHDCILGNHVIMANSANLAGHITIEDSSVVGGLVGVHQFVRIGTHAMIGGGSGVTKDVPPYTLVSGHRGTLHGLNLVGLKRRGVSGEALNELKAAYKTFFRSGLTIQKAAEQVRAENPASREVEVFVHFIVHSERGVTRE